MKKIRPGNRTRGIRGMNGFGKKVRPVKREKERAIEEMLAPANVPCAWYTWGAGGGR